ncbi:MAG: flavin reductase family protein [Campylobacteraceae bacterium]|jgi:flavin reductase (DIM6/NTAB) family NADH-FMN oxidoreductase RutF|nr:flavin reductase family protein [Campylobacteraceae bacterium]
MHYHNFAEFAIDKTFQFIEPGPVLLLATQYKQKTNVMTLSWSTLFDFTPQIGCVLSPGDYTFEMLKAAKECVLGIPAVDIMEKTVQIGNCSGKDADKFKIFNLTPLPAKIVKAPLIKECLVNIECKVTDTSLADRYGLFVMDGVKTWFDENRIEKRTFHANGDGTFVIDGETKNLKHLMTKWQIFI